MGITLEDVLKELNQFKESLDYYLVCKGYNASNILDIKNNLINLEQKIREVEDSNDKQNDQPS